MGGCYSATSHKALNSPQHKQPRKGSLQQNGRSPDRSYTTPRANSVPSISIPTKASSVPDQKGDLEGNHVHAEGQVVSPECVVPLLSAPDGEQVKGVVPSDSGIESIGCPQEESGSQEPVQHELSLCRSCHQKLQRISRGSCHQCGNFRIDSSEFSALVAGDTYCTCGPRVPGRQVTCRTHRLKGPALPTHRHSDMLGLVLKSNLKKEGVARGEGKRVRMSWKSADSLDMGATMNTCMDRAKSEASEIFGDDVSFRAPLAQFDSVDCQLDTEGGGIESSVFPVSRMSIYSEILDLADCICKCDFSGSQKQEENMVTSSSAPADCRFDDRGLPFVQGRTHHIEPSPVRSLPDTGRLHVASRRDKEDDDDSGHGVSKSEERSNSVTDSDIDTGEESDRQMSVSSSPARQGVATGLEGHVDWIELRDSGVCPVMVKGRRMVVMDAETYTQMLSSLALLREELGHLTQVIQEEEDIPELNLSMPVDD